MYLQFLQSQPIIGVLQRLHASSSMQAALSNFSVARRCTVPSRTRHCYAGERLFGNSVWNRKRYQVTSINKPCGSLLLLFVWTLAPYCLPEEVTIKSRVNSWSALQCAHSFSTVPLSSLQPCDSASSLLVGQIFIWSLCHEWTICALRPWSFGNIK